MSHKELSRLEVIQAVCGKRLRHREAAQMLGISTRQVKRLIRRYSDDGAAGLVSRHRGKRANNAISEGLRTAIMALVRSEYPDFGPTLAAEKLLERNGHRISAETLRQWMVADGLWRPKRRRDARIHQRRQRRPCLGELVQIDGSPHLWFEERAPGCTLIVFIDDATGRLLALRFYPAETTQAYMETLGVYLASHGRPVALYSDKHSIFRVNQPGHDGELTQFGRALKTLDIEAIHANTPQAKGRVERANQTLQDRLVKELRLRGIMGMEDANAFMPAFMQAYNARFAVPARFPEDTHRQVLHAEQELDLILRLHYNRKLSKNLTFQFSNRQYQLQTRHPGYRLRGAAVTVCEAFDGAVTILHEGKPLTYRVLAAGEPPTPLDDEKSVHQTVDQAKARQQQAPGRKPAIDHPWRQYAVKTAPLSTSSA